MCNTSVLTLLIFLPAALQAQCAIGPYEEFFDIQDTGLREWRLVFRGTAYINKSVYEAYRDGSDVPAIVRDACRGVDWTQPCDTHYRNVDALGKWDNILEVMLAIVDDGKIVKSAIFNGVGSTYMDWMSEARYKNSSWSDLGGQHPKYYGIKGHDSPKRHFFINQAYHGCDSDSGWTVAIDGSVASCKWEKVEAFPVFRYAAGDHVENWTSGNFRNGDALAVFVRYSSAGVIG